MADRLLMATPSSYPLAFPHKLSPSWTVDLTFPSKYQFLLRVPRLNHTLFAKLKLICLTHFLHLLYRHYTCNPKSPHLNCFNFFFLLLYNGSRFPTLTGLYGNFNKIARLVSCTTYGVIHLLGYYDVSTSTSLYVHVNFHINFICF